jgi:hypothetical protein
MKLSKADGVLHLGHPGGCREHACEPRVGSMYRALTAIAVAFVCVAASVASAATPPRYYDLLSAESVLRWINGYRAKPAPEGVPEVVKALSRLGAFKDAEQAGVYVGFIAGAIGANPDKAEQLIGKMFPLQAQDHWVIVRAIAYSGHPEWRRLLRVFTEKMPTRRVMIQRYLAGTSPTLFQVAPERRTTFWQKTGTYLSYDTYFGEKKAPPRLALEPSPELLDTFWGYYFATGRYRPVSRIVAMLPLSQDKESVDKLTLGSMAKFTLAANASRDFKLLAMLKSAAANQPKEVAPILNDVIDAAETVETARIRKQQLAKVQELQRKGPGTWRSVSQWGQVGIGALSLGCIAAAATGQVYLGLPCVVGGALSTAGLKYWESQQ